MGFDYGDLERNLAEQERLKGQGRAAALMGDSCFGAGGYNPGDAQRAHYWLLGYAQMNPNHPDMPARYRTDGGSSELEKLKGDK